MGKERSGAPTKLKKQHEQKVDGIQKELDAVEVDLATKMEYDEEVEDDFLRVMKMPRLRFECCMLQVPVEDTSGALSWRDMACDDVDDLEALRSRAWLPVDFVLGDKVLKLPVLQGCELPVRWL